MNVKVKHSVCTDAQAALSSHDCASSSSSAPCPTALSFGDSREIIGRARMLITVERPAVPLPQVPRTLQQKRGEKEKPAKKSLAVVKMRGVCGCCSPRWVCEFCQISLTGRRGSQQDAFNLQPGPLKPLHFSNELFCMALVCLYGFTCGSVTGADSATG